MIDFKEQLTNSASRLGKKAGSVAEELQSRAQSAWNCVGERTTRAVREPAACVRENPVSTALVVFGLGLVLGLLLGRRPPAPFQERAVAEPLHRSRGLLPGFLLGIFSMFRRTIFLAFGLAYRLVCQGRGLHQPCSMSRGDRF